MRRKPNLISGEQDMASIWNQTVDIFSDLSHGDPRIDDNFLMRSPLEIILILALYLLFVLKVGPWLMEKRKPFDLKKVLIVYNFAQIVLNCALFLIVCCEVHKRISVQALSCFPQDFSDNPTTRFEVKIHYWYLLLKILDLFDTIVIVLRKRYRQLSFLHVHHHTGIVVATWISGKYFPVGQGIYTGLFNTLIHTVMYFYYFLTSLEIVDKNIWWKKYLTIAQLVQHYCIFVTTVASLVNINCSYPKQLLTLYTINIALHIYLFHNFFIKNYVNNDKSKKNKIS